MTATGLVMVCDVDLGVPDGARTHTVELARGFARAGLDVTLVARGPDPQIGGVRYRSARGSEQQRGLRAWALTRAALGVLGRERGRAHRLYVRDKWTTVPAALVGRLLGYRVVCEIDDLPYGPGYQGELSPFVDRFKTGMTFLMGRLSRGVVAGTEEARRLLAAEFRVPPHKIQVIPIGVDTEYFRPADRRESMTRAGLEADRRYALFLGHFASWVDFDTLITAFARVAAVDDAARLVLVGDGAERERIAALISAHGIEDAVVMTGFVHDRERIRDLLGAASVLLACHRAEHLDRIGMNATKIAEYLASGRPIVAKNVAGLRDMIETPGAGMVVDEDPQAMAEAILAVLDSDRSAAMGERARRTALERFSWDATIRATLPLFGA